MSKPIYHLVVTNNNVARNLAWNALPETERKALEDQESAAMDAVGAKVILVCDSAWADEMHPWWGVVRYPDLEARIEETRTNRKIGWLDFKPFHGLIENYIRSKEQGYTHYRVVYGAWFQGMFGAGDAEERQLRNDRNLYHDLMHAGIDPKFMPMPQSGSNEKGADVALAIEAM